MISVVIPARDEERVIGRCLATLLDGIDDRGQVDIVVVCNGCTDGTADVVRAVTPWVTVLELAEGSKPAALDAGDRAALARFRKRAASDSELRRVLDEVLDGVLDERRQPP